MKNLPLKLEDLVPKETTFVLESDEYKDQKFTLCRWSLRVRVWATDKYTSAGLKIIFEQQKIEEIADMAWFMLKDKAPFKDQKDLFLDAIVTIRDQIAVIKALLGAVGIGEPEIEKITASVAAGQDPISLEATLSPKKQPSPRKKTGAKSSTP